MPARPPVRHALGGMLLLSATSWLSAAEESLLVDKAPDRLFAQLDKNGDGKLTADEVGEERRAAFERMLRQGDKDGDGVLTRAEFLMASRPQTVEAPAKGGEKKPAKGDKPSEKPAESPPEKSAEKPAEKPASPAPEPQRERRPEAGPGGGRPGEGRPEGRNFDPAAFVRNLDRNQDGKITLEELPERIRDRAAKIFEEADAKEMSVEEFGTAMGRMMRSNVPGGEGAAPGGGPGGGMANVFRQWDRNGDGALELDEVPEPARERFQPMFERAQVDKIPLDRLQNMMGRMRGEGGPEGREGRPEGGRPEGRGEGRGGFGPGGPGGFGQGGPGGFGPGGMGPGGMGPGGMGGMRQPPVFLRRLDRDGDGKISADEWAKGAELFAEFDTNKDGYLDLMELMGRPMGGPGEGRPGEGREGRRPEGDRPEGTRPERPRRPEGDDTPAARPAPEARSAPEPPRPERPEASPRRGNEEDPPRRPLRRMDTDGDGRLSKEEARGRLKENFDRLDTNRDGYLDAEEIRKALQELGTQLRPTSNRQPGKTA